MAFVTADLGLGGTGKGVVSFATRLDPRRFSAKVITLLEGGPREMDLVESGVPFVLGVRDVEGLTRELANTDVVHVFRHGIADPVVPTAAERAGVPVLIESNIFGARDRSADESRFACHLLVSMMCLMRYRARLPADPSFAERHRVQYFPPEAQRLRELAPERPEARRALGLDPDRPVVARVGRAQDLKWRNLLVDMVPHLVRLVPEVQVLFIGATEAKRSRLARRGLSDRVALIDRVVGDANLATVYAACDVVVNASMIGESQGLAIAEAMALGVPVVTCSTPWADNAQVEFVDNGRNGWVANHPREYAEAVADLLLHSERRDQFGRQARQDIDRQLDPAALTRQLEQLYDHHLNGSPVTGWAPAADDSERFARDYPRRAKASFRSLTPRERAECLVARGEEELVRKSAGARMAASIAWRRVKPT